MNNIQILCDTALDGATFPGLCDKHYVHANSKSKPSGQGWAQECPFNKSWGLEVVDVRDTLPSKCMNK